MAADRTAKNLNPGKPHKALRCRQFSTSECADMSQDSLLLWLLQAGTTVVTARDFACTVFAAHRRRPSWLNGDTFTCGLYQRNLIDSANCDGR